MRYKKYVGCLLISSLTYNVVLQPLLNASFDWELPLLRLDDQLLKILAGVFSLLGV